MLFCHQSDTFYGDTETCENYPERSSELKNYKGLIMNNRIRRQVQSTHRKRQVQRQKNKINSRRLGQFLSESQQKS